MDYVAEAEKLSVLEMATILESYQDLKSKFQEISDQLEFFKKQLFGQKSEVRKLEVNNNQLTLGALFEITKEEITQPELETISYSRKKRVRGALPGNVNEEGLQFNSDVPKKIIKLPNLELKGLSEDEYEVIGVKTSHTLGQLPASYVVLEYQQEVVKIKATSKITESIKFNSVLEGSYADVSFLANLLIDKYLYHLPLYRQHQRIAQAGIKISRASLTNYVHRIGDLLNPIYQALILSIASGKIVSLDETPIKAGHNKSKQKLKSGYFWSMYGELDEVAFYYSLSRAHSIIYEILGSAFSGTLQTDGYEAYRKYCEILGTVEHALCWSHTRRNFIKAEEQEPKLVNQALSFIAELYKIEDSIKSKTSDDKQKTRGEESKLVVDKFYTWLNSTFSETVLLPTNQFTKAANYALQHEKELRVFLSNPEVTLDTNHLERQIRPIAVGRKNWLFCWTEVGAEVSAIIYSLIASCKLHDVNPYEYFVDVLQRVQVHPSNSVDQLLPRNWKNNFQNQKLISVLDVNPNLEKI